MENIIEATELSTDDLDTVAGGCGYKEDYGYEKKKKHHHHHHHNCHKPRKGCDDYGSGYGGGYSGGYDSDDSKRY